MALSEAQRRQQQQRIEDCRELYLKHGGDDHEAIEREMHAMGHQDFHRRNLYRRFERGTSQPGWIEKFGWNSLLSSSTAETQRRREESDRSSLEACGARGNDDSYRCSEAEPVEQAAEDTSVCNTRPNDGHADQTASPVTCHPSPVTSTEELLPFDDFLEWLKRVSPGMEWEYKHQIYIYKRLKKLFEGVIKRLMIFMPPRHGKSELVTKHFAAYFLKKKPGKRIIIGSYNQQLANKFSRGIRNILAQDAFLEAQANKGEEPVFETPEALEASGSFRTSSGRQEGCRLDGSHSTNSTNSTNSIANFSSLRANSVAEWETPEGGGVRAVGVGAGVTGYGADLIIIDDPTKSRAEANSQTYRDRVYDWFNDDICTRLEPDGRVVLIQTRWHEDDLAGRLLKQMKDGGEQWEVISLPALAEPSAQKDKGERIKDKDEKETPIQACDAVAKAQKDEGQRINDKDKNETPDLSFIPYPLSFGGDPLDRQPGEALWPERYDEKALNKTKRQLGSFSFAALYQQTPVPAEGGLFKRKWFKVVPTLPPNVEKKRGWDFAMSKNVDADYTATAGVAYDKAGNIYIHDVIRRQIEFPEQRRLILGRIKLEPDTEHGIELAANGSAIHQALTADTSVRGSSIRGVKPTADKVTRALPWIALAESGNLYLVRGPWNDDFIDEACSFPLGTHDDQIDAVSLAVGLHRQQKHIAMGC